MYMRAAPSVATDLHSICLGGIYAFPSSTDTYITLKDDVHNETLGDYHGMNSATSDLSTSLTYATLMTHLCVQVK